MLIAAIVAPALRSLDQAYQFIQEYVGFVSPGVLAIFLLGFFWKKTTSAAALTGALITIPTSTILKFLPNWTHNVFPNYPFLDRMTITFFFVVVMMVIISISKPSKQNNADAIEVNTSMFKVSNGFIVASVIITGILAALYTVFW
jgi:SSS family solute:Na+ symporter